MSRQRSYYFFDRKLFVLAFVILGFSFKMVSGTSLKISPTLILTSDKLNQLRNISIYTELKPLWEASLLSADYFGETTIETLDNADNKYRFIGESLPSLALAYLVTNEQKYLNRSITILQQLLDVKEWSGDDNLGRSSWVMGTSLLYNWLSNDLPIDLKKSLQKRLLSEGEIIKNTASKYRALSNHLLIETAAIGMVGLALKGEDEFAKVLLNQSKEWSRYIIKHAPKDGSWGEGVQYWEYGLGYFLQFIEASKTAGDYNFYEEYQWLQETGYFPIYFSLPGRHKEVINFSDCSVKRKIPAFLLYLPAREYKNGYFQDFGNKIRSEKPTKYSWMNLLSYDSSVPVLDYRQLSTFKHFEDNGFVTMRSGWGTEDTVIGFRCGPAAGHANQNHEDRLEMHGFGPGHGHPDINSFMIFSQGDWLAIDPGYTYLKETRNHNTIVSNGAGQSGAGKKWLDYLAFEAKNPAPKIIKSESNASYDYVIGDAGAIYEDKASIKQFQRHLIFLKPGVIVVSDRVETKEPSTIDWILNTRYPIEEGSVDNDYFVKGNNVQLVLRFVNINTNRFESVISTKRLRASNINTPEGEKYGTMNTLMLNYQRTTKLQNMVVMSIQPQKGDTFSIKSKPSGVKICQAEKCWNLKYSNENNKYIITN